MKPELLRLLDLGRSKESETLLPHVDDSPSARPGEWTARDLRKGLDLRPDLVEWAAKDSDLDPIRDDPEVARLLEG